MEIRRARPDESVALTQVAHLGKRHWRYPEAWIESWKEALSVTPEYIESNPVYVLADDAKPIGFYALGKRGERFHLEHLWVKPRWIGLGLGKQLFQHAVRLAASMGGQSLHIESDPNAEGFYRKMGARPVGVATSEIEGQKRMLPRLLFPIV